MVPAKDRSLAAIVRRMKGKQTVKWAWRPFTSTARSKDSLQLSHWVRAAAEFPDYPFARFNKKIDLVRYTDDDYNKFLAPGPGSTEAEARWTREMTDTLFELCRRYDLRWAVIKDRFPWRGLTTEDLKLRFYTVMARVIRARINAMPNSGQSMIMKTQYTDFKYDPDLDVRRRRHVHAAFNKAKPERIFQERLLLDELRGIDARLETIRAAAEGGTVAATVLAEAMTFPKERSIEQLNLPTAIKPTLESPVHPPGMESPPPSAEASSSSTAAAAAAAATPGATSTANPAPGRWSLVGTLAAAKEGKPRGGAAAWNGRSSCFDAFVGVRLRSEQMAGMPDGTSHVSKLLGKVTSLLGELGVPAAGKMLPCAATLHALTVLRRQCAALLRLQQAVELRERTVTTLQFMRKIMALVPLSTEDPLAALSKARQRRREEAAVQHAKAVSAAASGYHARASSSAAAAVAATSAMPPASSAAMAGAARSSSNSGGITLAGTAVPPQQRPVKRSNPNGSTHQPKRVR